MNRTESQPLKRVLDEFLKENPILAVKLAETRLIASWNRLFGPGVSRYTGNIYIRNRSLYVQISSSVVKCELMMCRKKMVQKLNEEAGADVIDHIVLI